MTITIKVITTIAISIAIMSVNSHYGDFKGNYSQCNYDCTPVFVRGLNLVNFAASLAANLTSKSGKGFDLYQQKNRNKQMHTKNGNKSNQAKNKSHIKMMIVNKGHSNYSTNKNILVNLVANDKPDILVILESNLE